MKAVITFFFAVCLLASCTTEYQCHSYGQTNQSTGHGTKAQAKYAKHNKHKSLF